MKTISHVIQTILIATGAALLVGGCSSLPGSSESGKSLSSSGPTVLNARAEPSTVELNRKLQPVQDAEVVADVKDFTSKITDVKLRFVDVPIQVAMENIGGTTWRARLSPEQLRTLAVSGKTIKYDANVIAKNEKGQTAMSSSPISVGVTAPDLSKAS